MRQIKQPSFAELFVPKLVTVLREGYGFSDLRNDAISGLTVAIVALPLSMAIAIASGATPDRQPSPEARRVRGKWPRSKGSCAGMSQDKLG